MIYVLYRRLILALDNLSQLEKLLPLRPQHVLTVVTARACHVSLNFKSDDPLRPYHVLTVVTARACHVNLNFKSDDPLGPQHVLTVVTARACPVSLNFKGDYL